MRILSANDCAADRLSVAVSVLLMGGLLYLGMTLFQYSDVHKVQPRPLNSSKSSPVVENSPPSTTSRMGVTIKLPLPPAPPAPVQPLVQPPVTEISAKLVAKNLLPLKPEVRLREKLHLVEPLQKSVVERPAANIGNPLKFRPRTPMVKDVVSISKQPKTVERSKTGPTNVAKLISSQPAQLLDPPKPIVNGSKNRQFGGVLLRLLEHGKGPNIEIGWPRRLVARRALHRHLTRCYGVRSAVLAANKNLYVMAGRPGHPWAIEMDRYSGFIRSPQGEPILKEAKLFQTIAEYHELNGWRPVRVFPRSVDAALLGGLGAVLGEKYKTAKRIRATYRWDGESLKLGDFIVDGSRLEGVVMLPAVRGLNCRFSA